MTGCAVPLIRPGSRHHDVGMPPFPPEPLDPCLTAKPFTVATARGIGATADRLRASDLDRRVHGVRAPRGFADDVHGRCRMLTTRLSRDAFISHSTAARLLGVPLPARLERATRIHVTVPAPARAPHAAGIRGHSRRVEPRDVVVDRDGLRISGPERVICELSGILALDDLVAVIDHLVSRRHGVTTLEAVARRVGVGDRIARSRRLTEALALADPGAESRAESRLRVLLAGSGLSGWVANGEVVCSSGHRFRLDLALPHRKRALEYQGEHHVTLEQRRRDMTRRSLLEADGWRVLEVNTDDLDDPAALAARIRRFLALA